MAKIDTSYRSYHYSGKTVILYLFAKINGHNTALHELN